jgi:small subunit ribosomal protein S1
MNRKAVANIRKAADRNQVLLDQLEDENGCVVLSYQKAKSLKAWDKLAELAASDEPIKGVVTHKVKGGLSVDVGIPAFLPGSQVDIIRVNNFDQFVGQEITCRIIKINRKRGNVIVSRRRFLEDIRSEEKKQALDVIQEGQTIEGIVKNITNYGAFVDVGGVDGLLHITDMSWGRIGHPSELLKIGDKVKVKVISFNKEHEKISLGIKQLQENPWDNIEERYPLKAEVEGVVSNIADYGLFVEIEKGLEGLVHISEVSWTERIHNLNKHYNIGDKVKVMVLAIDREGGRMRMRLSIKRLEPDPWALVFEKFKVGDKIHGAITNITDFGVFVQLHEGVDGLVHISDISWTEHVTHPTERYKKGDAVDVVILGIDRDNKRISLGIKQLDRDPWDTLEEEYPVGRVVEGVVSKVTSFGAFVKFANGVEGLAHVSELSNHEIDNVEEFIKVNSTHSFKVVKSSKNDRKLGLSLRAVTEPEETAAAAKREFQQPPRSKEPRRKDATGTAPKKTQKADVSSMKGSLQQALESHMRRDDEYASE